MGEESVHISYSSFLKKVYSLASSQAVSEAQQLAFDYKKSVELSNDDLGKIAVILGKAYISFCQENYAESNSLAAQIEYDFNNYSKKNSLNEDYLELKQKFYTLRGLCYKRIEQFDIAIVFNKKASELAKKLNNPRLVCNSLVNLGNLYYYEKQYEKAEEVYNKALRYANELPSFKGRSAIYNGLSSCLGEIGRFKEAYEYADKAVVWAVKENHLTLIPIVLCNQAYNCLFYEEQFHQVPNLINRLENMLESNSFTAKDSILIDFNRVKALYALRTKNYQEVLSIILPSEGKANIEQHIKVSFADYLVEAYIGLNQKEKAIEAYKKFKELNDKDYHIARKMYFKRQSQYLDMLYSEMDQGKELLDKEMAERERAEKDKAEILQLKKITEEQKKELEEKSQHLRAVNESLQQFSRTVAHDLKEPLRTINGFVNLLKKKEATNFSENAKEYMSFISISTERMENMIGNILQNTKVGFTDVTIENVNLNQIIKNVLLSLNYQINSKKARVEIEKLPIITGNVELIQLLFQNLISNAIKFTQKDIKPQISVGSVVRDDETIFYVADNGIGISKENKEKIFNSFERLNNPKEFDGTGLGLSTCSKIVKLHNGKIWIEENENGGTIFYFILNPPNRATKDKE